MKKINRWALLFVIASLSVLLGAVVNFGQKTESSGTKWLLTEIDGKAISASKAYIEINNEKTRFSGHNGCNRMFGPMELAGNKLTIGNIGSTKMACLDADGDVEKGFMDELGRINGLKQTGDALEMLDGERVALKFKAAAIERPLNLEDKKWVLESIKGNAIEVKGEAPFISFDSAKQSAGGNTSCNLFGGSYTTEGSKLTIKETFSTMRACIEDNRMDIERQFLDALGSVTTYEIKDGKLSLKNGDAVLMTFLGKAK